MDVAPTEDVVPTGDVVSIEDVAPQEELQLTVADGVVLTVEALDEEALLFVDVVPSTVGAEDEEAQSTLNAVHPHLLAFVVVTVVAGAVSGAATVEGVGLTVVEGLTAVGEGLTEVGEGETLALQEHKEG